MPVIYLEDILEQGGNKYLSVNIAAGRARELNSERSLPMLMNNAQKPVTVAIDELRSGKIGYEALDQPRETMEDSPFGSIDGEEDKEAEVLEEFQPTAESYDEGSVKDPDEAEEGM
jgi:DNA-directed RNA polymerase omega subunit